LRSSRTASSRRRSAPKESNIDSASTRRAIASARRPAVASAKRALFPSGAIFASATPEIRGDRDLGAVRKPGELADVDVGVVRGVFGVAETGSVWLTCNEFHVDSLGFLAQHLVVLLDRARIVATMHDAYRERTQFDVRYGVFMTGPSATADIEGVLIHGAQGVRSLTVVPAPR